MAGRFTKDKRGQCVWEETLCCGDQGQHCGPEGPNTWIEIGEDCGPDGDYDWITHTG